MDSNNTQENILIQFILFDSIHRQELRRFTFSCPAESLRQPVSSLLQMMDTSHKLAWDASHCTSCTGKMLIKSGWLTKLPVETARDLVRPMADLTSGGPLNLEFMKPWVLGNRYIKQSAAEDTVTIICETVNAEASNPHTSKRPRTDSEANAPDTDNEAKRAKLGSTPTQNSLKFKGLRIVPSTDQDALVILPEPHLSFYSLATNPGVVFVDKTRFIPKLYELLGASELCMVALPPNTGKTTLLSALLTWLDCRGRALDEWLALFSSLEVGQGLTMPMPKALKPDSHDLWTGVHGGRDTLCLHFDLKTVTLPAIDSDRALANSITAYLRKTIEAFITKYQQELGYVKLASRSGSDLVTHMVKNILTRVENKGLKLFVGIDHWCYPIIEALSYLEHDSATVGVLSKFICSLMPQIGEKQKSKSRVRILILGNLPVLEEIQAAAPTPIDQRDISTLLASDGRDATFPSGTAFGITPDECAGLAAVLSHKRSERRMRWQFLNEQRICGGFKSHPRTPQEKCGSIIYDFSLVLQYLAKAFDLNSGHRMLPDSTALQNIAENCQSLLEQSSLRRERKFLLSPHYGISAATLRLCETREPSLWILLHYMGVIRRDREENIMDMWEMTPSSIHAQKQLFGRYPPMKISPYEESEKEIYLRALLERNPYPFTNALSDLLRRKPLFDLFRMDEAVLQAIIDCSMEDSSRNGCKDEEGYPIVKGRYIHNYFAQLGLRTNLPGSASKSVKHAKSGPAGKSTQTQYEPSPSGLEEYGYMDCFIAALRRLGKNCAICMEAKYCSPYGFGRGKYGINEWRQFEAALDADGLRYTALKTMQNFDSLTIPEIEKLNYCYFDRDRKEYVTLTVKKIIDNAKVQLQSYMAAIAAGQAAPDKKGITGAETRIIVKKCEEGEPADELIGYIILGLGRRIIAIEVEPDVQNTEYRFLGTFHWWSTHEQKLETYEPNRKKKSL
ncbi:hypothetical protein R3P38DRAFT_3067544 [Favolaschia claudopus]|uniref:AAA-ATPase-like domain-containing protein n=1 Tax=Favolaschia claudopus TaxID=2862362 RepID=A0AAW0A154_9AGAR